jgi:hypothetical protein
MPNPLGVERRKDGKKGRGVRRKRNLLYGMIDAVNDIQLHKIHTSTITVVIPSVCKSRT